MCLYGPICVYESCAYKEECVLEVDEGNLTLCVYFSVHTYLGLRMHIPVSVGILCPCKCIVSYWYLYIYAGASICICSAFLI